MSTAARSAWAALACAATLTLARPPAASAQERPREEEARADANANADASADSDAEAHGRVRPPRRAVPDYDGRGPRPETTDEILIWIPRVLLWPVHAVLEYVVRQPIGALLTTAERERWDGLMLLPPLAAEPTWGFVPTVFFDFGFRPSAGLLLWAEEFPVQRSSMQVQAAYGGAHFMRGTVIGRFGLPLRGADLQAQLDARERDDQLYLGPGPNAQPSLSTRYNRQAIRAQLAFRVADLWRASSVRFTSGLSANAFDDTDYRDGDDELSMRQAVAEGRFPLPAAFDSGYTALLQRIEAAFDTREKRPANESGFRIEGFAQFGLDLADLDHSRWVLYGGTVGGFVDTGHARTLGLWVSVANSNPLGDLPIPFTELPQVGARGRLSAFQNGAFSNGWLAGESYAAVNLEWRYPIWFAVDGVVSVAMGNAFGQDLDGFALDAARLSAMIGIRANDSLDQAFTLQIGFGTDPIDQGFSPVVFRVGAGIEEGF